MWDFWEEERRRTLTAGDKKWLLLRARGKCEYCRGDITAKGIKEEIHHIRQWAGGGSDRDSNLIVLCPNCHSKADLISPEEFKRKIAYRLAKPKEETKAAPKQKARAKAAPKPKARKKAAPKPKARAKAAPKPKARKKAAPKPKAIKKKKVATKPKAIKKKKAALKPKARKRAVGGRH